jgi:hypothetical protein
MMRRRPEPPSHGSTGQRPEGVLQPREGYLALSFAGLRFWLVGFGLSSGDVLRSLGLAGVVVVGLVR